MSWARSSPPPATSCTWSAARSGTRCSGVSSGTPDLDFATDARPEQVLEIVRGWAEAHLGRRESRSAPSGCSAAGSASRSPPIAARPTTARAAIPRLPYGDSLDDDLAPPRLHDQRDGGARSPQHVFVDLFGGLADLGAKVLRTPGSPEAVVRRRPVADPAGGAFRRRSGVRVPDPALVEAMRSRAETAVHRCGRTHP